MQQLGFDELQWDELVLGAGAGVASVLIVLVAMRVGVRIGPRWMRACEPLLVWGLVTAVALVVTMGRSPIALVGVALLAAGAMARDEAPVRDWLRLALTGAGIAVLVLGVVDADWKLTLAAVLTAVGGTALASGFEWVTGPVTMMVALAATSVGVYINVPDTEQIAVVGAGLGVLAIAALVFDGLRARPEPAAVALAVALVLGSGADGARGRPEAFVAVVAALGVVLVYPVIKLAVSRASVHPVLLLGLHGAAVVAVSRLTIGESALDPAAIALGCLGAVAVGLFALAMLHRRVASPRD